MNFLFNIKPLEAPNKGIRGICIGFLFQIKYTDLKINDMCNYFED